LWVTDVDRLKADPYAFYAKRMLRLGSLDPVDADPTAAWRGTAVHAVLEAWMREDDCDPSRLAGRAKALLDDPGVHPMLRALVAAAADGGDRLYRRKMAEGPGGGAAPALAEVEGSAFLSCWSSAARGPAGRCAGAPWPSSTTRPASRPRRRPDGGVCAADGLLGAIAGGAVSGVTGVRGVWNIGRSRAKGESGFGWTPRNGRQAAEFGESSGLFDEARPSG
jgi:ATP-dependent helicase/nuclease subunit B